MKLFSFLRRPAWESADASRRAQAVASEHHADLIRRLPDIARHDADADVRLAAVRRVDDLSLLADRARLDLANHVRDAARQRLRHFLLLPDLPREQRERQIRVLDDEGLLEAVAAESDLAPLRRIALERIQRAAFLADRCARDADPEIRMDLLARIEDMPALEKIADKARKSDKHLARAARDKLLALRLAARDPAATRERAESICRELEQLMRQRGDDAGQQLERLRREWQTLTLAAEDVLCKRFHGLADTVDALLHPATIETAPAAAVVVATETPPAGEIAVQTPVQPERSSGPDGAALLAEIERFTPDRGEDALADLRRRFEACANRSEDQTQAFESVSAHWKQHFSVERDKRRLRRETLDTALASLALGIEQGRLADARSAFDRLTELESEWPRRFWEDGQRRMAELEAEFGKLSQWAEWAARDQKKRLNEQAEALIDSGLHPDALLNRCRELQDEWEKHFGKPDTAADGQARRFRAVIARALAPAKPYLEKRKELRSAKRVEAEQRLSEIEAAVAAQDGNLNGWFDLQKQVKEFGTLLDELVGSERRAVTERRNSVGDAIRRRIDAIDQECREAKTRFIAGITRQIAAADAREQSQIAKQAMAQWKSLPRGLRKSEDTLWEQFRAAIDPVFARDRAFFEQRDQERKAQEQAVLDLIEQAEQAATQHHASQALNGVAEQLQQRFRELQADAAAEARFQPALEALRQSARTARQTEQAMQREHLRTQSARLAEFEAQARAGQVPGAEQIAELGFDPVFTPRIQRLADLPSQELALAALTELAIRAELLAGIDSPESDRVQRKAIQMARLSGHLSGARHSDSTDSLFATWLQSADSGSAAAAPFDQRIGAALDRA